MTPRFSVRTTPEFDRRFKKLTRHHRHLPDTIEAVAEVLSSDPYNRSRTHPIKKLEGSRSYRLRQGRWRFIYTVQDEIVWLTSFSLRREDTYRG